MIEIIFTMDYEIYGNGAGSLRELVYEPTKRLISIFKEWHSVFVVFVEAAEFERIEKFGTDEAIGDVRAQLRQLYNEGFEIGLHLHPQWCNARRENGRWLLDASEYNLCTLTAERLDEIIGGSIEYLGEVLGSPDFLPISFRAGNWLFQPTKTVAGVLSEYGIRIDSSVFKGGRQRNHNLDYRPALRNGYYWSFADDVNKPDPNGALIEIPIHTEMRPFWKMFAPKRLGLQRRNITTGNGGKRLIRLLDFMRFTYPCKLDFCRMTYDEMRSFTDGILREDERSRGVYKPIVAIGHSKDLVDYDSIGKYLSYVRQKKIPVSTFRDIVPKLQSSQVGSRQG